MDYVCRIGGVEIECATAGAAVRLVKELRGRYGNVECPTRDERREKVAEWLRENKSGSKSEILRACDIPIGTMHDIFNCDQFVKGDDNKMRLSGAPVEEDEDAPTSNKQRIIKALGLRPDGLSIADIAEKTGLSKTQVSGSLYAYQRTDFRRANDGKWHLPNGSTLQELDEEEADEVDEPTDVEDETDVDEQPKTDNRRWKNPDTHPAIKPSTEIRIQPTPSGNIKPKIVELLTKYADGLDPENIAGMIGLGKRQVQQCLFNHRNKTFARSEEGTWTLRDGPTPTKPATNKPTDKSRYANMVATLLKTDQPLELQEIARITKIPQAELFRVLADEETFERVDGMYWLAAK